MNIQDIKPYKLNAKKHAKKQIQQVANSIKRFGFVQPIVVDKNSEVVIGHCRLEAAKLLQLKEVPTVSVENLTDDEVKALRLADNKLNESDWNMDLVIDELISLGPDFDLLDLTGFSRDLIIEPEAKDDMIPEEAPAIAKLGDIYQLGRHKIMCGDSTKDIGVLMGEEMADMTFCDPPYNVNYIGSATKRRKSIENDNIEDYGQFLKDSINQMVSVSKETAPYYIFTGQKEIGTLQDAMESVGLNAHQSIIWKKHRIGFGGSDYQHQWEPIVYGWKNHATRYMVEDRTLSDVWDELNDIKSTFDGEYTEVKFDGTVIKIKGKAEGFIKRNKKKTDFWQFDRPAKSELHPTMKPVALICQAIHNSSKQGDIVLDTFLGSGSTLIACEKTGRTCYGVELDPKYIDTIIQRYKDYTGRDDIIKIS